MHIENAWSQIKCTHSPLAQGAYIIYKYKGLMCVCVPIQKSFVVVIQLWASVIKCIKVHNMQQQQSDGIRVRVYIMILFFLQGIRYQNRHVLCIQKVYIYIGTCYIISQHTQLYTRCLIFYNKYQFKARLTRADTTLYTSWPIKRVGKSYEA